MSSPMNASSAFHCRLAVATLLLITFSLSIAASTSEAQGFRLFRRNEPQQRKVSYNLDENSGPWLIMCASFDGQHGKQDAARLAEELSATYKSVYVYHRRVDLAKKLANKGRGYAEPKTGGQENVPKREMKPVNGAEVREEYAVLVGDFAKIDDASAQRALSEIKASQPRSLRHLNQSGEDSTLASARIRAQSDAVFGTDASSGWKMMNNQALQSKQPLKYAFLMANPLLSEAYFANQRLDPYIVKINTGLPQQPVEKRQTILRESRFVQWQDHRQGIGHQSIAKLSANGFVDESGTACIDPRCLPSQKRFCGIRVSRSIRKLCLRRRFDWVTRDVNGDTFTNPEVTKVMDTFRGRSTTNGVVFQGYPLPGKLLSAGIACDSTPTTVIVPKAPERRAGLRGMFR